MKKAILTLVFLALCSCNCKKDISSDNSQNKLSSIDSECPKDGKCAVEILKNKSLNYKADEFGIGYYILEENSKTSVIQYQYNRTVEKGLQDGNHKEEVLFEIDNSVKSLCLINSDLQKTKMVFGRICFCRGQMGYFKIENGNLNLTKNNETVTFDLDFKVTQVPQLYTKVKAVVK